MKLLAKANSIFDKILDYGVFLACAMLLFVMLSVNFEVIMRYFFTMPTIWVIEVSEVLLLYITFLAAPYVLKIEGHVKMDIVIIRLGSRTQAITNTVTSFLSAIGYSLVVWYGVGVTWDHFQRGTFHGGSVLEIPDALILAIIPIGSLLLFIQLLRMSRGYAGGWRGLAKGEQDIL